MFTDGKFTTHAVYEYTYSGWDRIYPQGHYKMNNHDILIGLQAILDMHNVYEQLLDHVYCVAYPRSGPN